MNQPTLAVYLFTFNTEKIRYPWRESVRSALELVGDYGCVYVADCHSEDGTWQGLQDMARVHHRLRLIRHNWGTSHEIQVEIANTLLDVIGQQADFALKLDADEVLHEASFDQFRQDLALMRTTYKVLGKPKYIHFCPDDTTTFPFIYDSKAVLSLTRAGQRFHDNDACALGGGGIPEYQTRLRVHHYGKMALGRAREALVKETEFTRLYYDLGFPDPKVQAQEGQGYLDYMKVFDEAAGRGEFHSFTGTHPKFMTDYLAEAHVREDAFRDALHDPNL